jgi:F-type H+-transporting ATPase subunit b
VNILTQFSTTESSGNVFSALGIDWKLLILQIVAFLILVWILKRYVYPWLIKSVDERQAKLEESTQAADEAKAKAEAAEHDIEKLMVQARKDAKAIVATAKDEATAAVEAAEAKASTRADKIVASAKEQIEKDVIAAQKTLHNQTIELVASATEKLLGTAVDSKVDQKVVAQAIEEVR